MPEIRDYNYAYETVTQDAGLTIPMCNYAAGDLLLVLCMADTGTPTWGCSGYTQLFAQTNTCALVCFWKIATASEDAVVVTSTVNETYNGCVIAIRDVNQTNPFGASALYSVVNQAAAARFALPQITTTVADSLILYASAVSVAGVPSIIEGPVSGLLGADGSAESMGVGWTMARSTGLTASDVFCSVIATGAGLKAAIQICPPSGGATRVPSYTPSDSSVLLEFLNGTTAFNGNTAIAATADTNFGTSLGGITANDATLAASADVGINSFHSFVRLTNAATANQVSGACMVFATGNRPNVASDNILCHLRPQSPGQYQRLPNLASNRGVWFGMRSASGNYKIWQVHGVGTSWPLDGKIPLVINASAGGTKASAGALSSSAIEMFGLWVSGVSNLQVGMEFGMLWQLKTTVVAGGSDTAPVDIEGIVSTCATGKERLSCLLQGAAQMLCLQPIQFGASGHSVFLDLNRTAVEFPQQADATQGTVFYNSIDDVVGFTYRGVSGDTIKHRNSVVSSSSRYHWRIDSNATSAATWDFSGLSLVGAGDVQLRAVTTFTGMVFNNCLTIAQNSAAVTGCTFNSGSYLVSDLPSALSNCQFISSGTGHAIEITAPGTYTFAGNTFTGYGSSGTTDAAVYNNSGGSVTLNITGGGSTPTVRNGAGASTTINASASVTLTGLVAGSTVYAYLGTDPATATVLSSVTSSGTSFVFSQSVAGQNGYITVAKAGYKFLALPITYSESDSSIPLSQTPDLSYSNPD